MSQFFQVATIHEIQPGQVKPIPVQGRDIVVFNDCGTSYAVKNSRPIGETPWTEEPWRGPSSPAPANRGSST